MAFALKEQACPQASHVCALKVANWKYKNEIEWCAAEHGYHLGMQSHVAVLCIQLHKLDK